MYYQPTRPVKKLNGKSFLLILVGVIAYFVTTIISAIITIATLKDVDYSIYEDLIPENQMEDFIALSEKFALIGAIVGLIISALISVYFIRRLLTNKKTPQGQRYITVLMVFSIIFAAFEAFALPNASIPNLLIGLFSLAVYVAIIVGCVQQKKYQPPYSETDNNMYGVPPYGIPPNGNPYAGNNPYGTPPNGNPYAGNNPYGTPPNGNPYAGNNPYGTPPNGNPYAGNNPYGTPPNSNPYAGNNPYGTPPNGNPYAGNNPYGTPPNDNPYATPNNLTNNDNANPYASTPNNDSPSVKSNNDGKGNNGESN